MTSTPLVDDPFDGRPRIFRDPIHGDIKWPRDAFGTLIRRLIDAPAFQRLRSIRQNGVTNLVFPGAEHSRFTHSIGVAWTASKMLDAIVRNSRIPLPQETREDTILAALLHDVGHGPFSHTLEDILRQLGVPFDHEAMTVRLLTEAGSRIHDLLEDGSSGRSERLAQYIDKTRRDENHWWHTLVSSQLDADRLDYIRRDARMAGIDNHRPDIDRLIEHLGCVGEDVVVDDRAFDVVESMLLALDHLYGAVYFHRTVRAATELLTSTLRCAASVLDASIPADEPLRALLERGQEISLEDYERLSDTTVWYFVDRWRWSKDASLSYLANRLWRRDLPKPVVLPERLEQHYRIRDRAHALATERVPGIPVGLLVTLDEPSRVNYRRYKGEESGDAPIRIRDRDRGRIVPIEDVERSIVAKVERRFYKPRLFVPPEIHQDLLRFIRDDGARHP
ncbi:HD domain-containing protein [Paraliomyxa miuraensis]|uniref:HD domain-containing protein n=1 Tax=Paraliomyxa miuraensis TaxID=376150 RepID=UPI00224D881F|nr:HD domain-containing protein [Paraliomyxa miuraensis]MCX4239765.1 HD domain-containing protein [Paraliomyxa miuraensis]